MTSLMEMVGGKKRIKKEIKKRVNVIELVTSILAAFNEKQQQLPANHQYKLLAEPNKEKTDTLVRLMVIDTETNKHISTVFDGWLSQVDKGMIEQKFDGILDNLIDNML